MRKKMTINVEQPTEVGVILPCNLPAVNLPAE